MAETAEQPITGLPKKTVTGITANDYILGIDSAEGYQMLIQDLGNYIIQHATSSLMGSNQTIAAALTTLNSNLGNSLSDGTNLDSLTLPANSRRVRYYHAQNIKSMTGYPTGVEIGEWPFCLELIPIGSGGTYTKQVLHLYGTYSDPDRIFERTQTYVSGSTSWSPWVQHPTRKEIATLNNSLTPSDVYNKTGLGINVRVLKMGKLVSIIWAGTLTQSLPVGWTTIVSDLPVSYFARSPFCEFLTTTTGKQYSIEIVNNGAISSLRFYPRGSAIDANEFIQGTVTFFCN